MSFLSHEKLLRYISQINFFKFFKIKKIYFLIPDIFLLKIINNCVPLFDFITKFPIDLFVCKQSYLFKFFLKIFSSLKIAFSLL